MGAGAAKHFQTDKAQHVAAVLSTVQEFQQRSHVDNIQDLNENHTGDEKFGKELFRRTVNLAAADARNRGENIDASLAQLTEEDIDTLCDYAQESNDRKDGYQGSVNSLLKMKQTISDTNLDSGNVDIDETTSVLSYGDDENEIDDESEVYGSDDRIMQRNSNIAVDVLSGSFHGASVGLVKTPLRSPLGDFVENLELSGEQIQFPSLANQSARMTKSSGNLKIASIIEIENDSMGQEIESEHAADGLEGSIEILEIEEKEEQEQERGGAFFEVETKRVASKTPSSATNTNHPRPTSNSNLHFFDLNDAFSKFWDNDAENSLSSIQSPNGMARFSPNPSRRSAPKSSEGSKLKNTPSKGGYSDYQRGLDEKNEKLMGLQRQKVLSYTQNAQLEREVELLKKQLEKMEQLERTFDAASANRGVFHDSMKHLNGNGARKANGQQSFQPHWQMASIYPIDEEQAGGFNDTTSRFDRSSNTIVSTSSPKSTSNTMQMKTDSSSSAVHRFDLSSSDEEDSAKVASSGPSNLRFQSQSNRVNNKASSTKAVDHEGLKRSYTYSHHPQEPTGVALQHQPSAQIKHTNGVARRRGRVVNDRVQRMVNGEIDSDDSNNSVGSFNNSNTRMERNSKIFHVEAGEVVSSDGENNRFTSNRRGKSDSVDMSIGGNGIIKKYVREENSAQKHNEASNNAFPPVGIANGKSNIRSRRRVSSDAVAMAEKNPFDAEIVGTSAFSDNGAVEKKSSLNSIPPPVADIKSFHGMGEVQTKGRALQGANRRRRHSITGDLDDLDSSHDDKAGPVDSVTRRGANRGLDSRSSICGDESREASGALSNAPSMSAAVASVAAAAKRRVVRAARSSHDGLSSLPVDDSDGERNKNRNLPQADFGGRGRSVPLWSEDLDRCWAEVSLLLRKPIVTEQDMLYTVAASEAGLMYIDQMDSIAKNMKVMRGALTRWLLPYDNNTRIDNQCSTPHSVLEHMPPEFKGKLSERQIHYLVAGANGVRKLVRVKIADDNDLEQARKAVKETDDFFKNLYSKAQENNMKPFDLLKMSNLI